MVVLLTCKNEKDLIKNESARVVTTLYINLFRRSEQITPALVVGSGRNFKLFSLSCMSLLSARLKMVLSKMKGLEWSQPFSHFKSMAIFPDAHGQLAPQSLVGFGRI